MSRTEDVIGVALGPDAIHAVLVRNGDRIWDARVPRDEECETAASLRELLRQAPSGRLRRSRVRVAVGAFASQFKRLAGVPGDAPGAEVARVLEANLTRFFLRNGEPVRVTAVEREGDAWWGAAIESRVIAQVVVACGEVGLRLDGVAPSVVAIAADAPDGMSVLREGKRVLTIERRQGRFVSLAAALQDPGPGTDVTESYSLERAAEGVARLPRAQSWLFDPAREKRTRQRRSWRRSVLAAFILGALIVAAAAPWLRASIELRVARMQLATLGTTAVAASADAAGIQRALAAWERIETFEASRRSMLRALALVSGALPDSTAIVSLAVDDGGVHLVALAPRGADLVESLATLEGFDAPHLIGAVTRETLAGRELQRVALSLRLTSVVTTRPAAGERP
jgi:hypothetical protein